MQDSGFQVLLQGNNFLRILQGLGVTIGISIVSVLLSLLLGTLFGIVMTSKSKIIRFLSRIYLEFIRIMPQLVLLFIVYFGLARNFNINISGELSAIIVFTLWGTAEMGDLVRGQSHRYLNTSLRAEGPWPDQWATLYLCDYSTSLASLVASGY